MDWGRYGFLKRRLLKYAQDGKNHFSETEGIMLGFMFPKLFSKFVPKGWQQRPLECYFHTLDDGQRELIKKHFQDLEDYPLLSDEDIKAGYVEFRKFIDS